MKFLKLLSVFIFVFSFIHFASAECPVSLSCGQALELSWSASGPVTGCSVRAPSGGSIAGTCSSNGWTSNNVPVQSGTYRFEAYDAGSLIEAECSVTAATNCGGTYTISASPNPIQICSPATTGASTVSWNAPAGQAVVVYMNGASVTSGTGSGSYTASTLALGQNYVFTVRKASTPSVVEGTVTVTGTTAGCSGTGPGTGFCGDSKWCRSCDHAFSAGSR
jgi:hypothetical protein